MWARSSGARNRRTAPGWKGQRASAQWRQLGAGGYAPEVEGDGDGGADEEEVDDELGQHHPRACRDLAQGDTVILRCH
jgi:hypothetical protein